MHEQVFLIILLVSVVY